MPFGRSCDPTTTVLVAGARALFFFGSFELSNSSSDGTAPKKKKETGLEILGAMKPKEKNKLKYTLQEADHGEGCDGFVHHNQPSSLKMSWKTSVPNLPMRHQLTDLTVKRMENTKSSAEFSW